MGALSEAVAKNVRKQRPAHPKGWEPHVEEHGDGTATAISQPIEDADPDEHDLIVGWGLDADEWRIVGRVNCRRWQTYDERWLHYYKADLVRRDRTAIDLDKLVKAVIRRRPRSAPATSDVGNAFVVNLADWQVGKSDGYPSADAAIRGTQDTLADMIGKVEDRVRDLRRMGIKFEGLYVHGLGDLGESCGGHYAQQAFRTVLNQRDQRKVIRWALDSSLDAWSRLFGWVGVHAVGGNHGEEREEGKSYTDFADNRDVAVFEDVAFAYGKNDERYGHVSFNLPNDDLTLTYQHGDTIVGLAHGHQAGFATSGSDPAAKIDKWWTNQMRGQQPIGDADVLITGHYHHLWCRTTGKRTHFGCPALEKGSDWWRNSSGLSSPPGTLTFVLDGRGWQAMEVL